MSVNPKLSPAMRNALERAAFRSRGTICPTIGVHAAAQASLLAALSARGLIDYDGPVPIINAAGRAAIAANHASTAGERK